MLFNISRGVHYEVGCVEAVVGGAVRARPAGAVAFGLVGNSASGVAAFTITLGAEGSSGASGIARLPRS